VRELLLKPAALGAAIGLAFFGVVVLLVSSFSAHASTADSSSDCGSPPTTSTVLTSAKSAAAGGGSTATTLSTSAVASSSDSSATDDDSPSPTDSTSPSDTTSPTDTPSASDSSSTTATPSDTSSSTSADPSSSDASGTDDSTDQTPAPTASTSPSPTPSTSASPTPTAQLCVLVQSYPSSGDVLAGDQASYVVWAWSVDADSSDVSVTASVPAASYLGTPGFSICPSASGATCTIASLPVGQVYELLAAVPVTSDATIGTEIDLTATATGTGELSDASDAIDTVVSASTAASSSSDTDTSGTAADEVPPLISLPPIPGTGVTATNPSDLFPTVSPSQGSGTITLPAAQASRRAAAHATEATSYAVPIDPRLLGAQIIGLVALAAAVTIAIVRLSLRKPQVAASAPTEPTDPPTAS
jgi:hypothetical protein